MKEQEVSMTPRNVIWLGHELMVMLFTKTGNEGGGIETNKPKNTSENESL